MIGEYSPLPESISSVWVKRRLPARGRWTIRIARRGRCENAPKMVLLSFSTDRVEVSVPRHPSARLFFHSRAETDRRAQQVRNGDLPPTARVQSCPQPRNGGR